MKALKVSLKFFAIMTVLTGFVYPGLIGVVGQLFFSKSSNGSLIYGTQGKIIGSELIAQNFKGEKYFWPRPSAIDFNPMPSGGSNLGPTSQDLVTKFHEREKQGFTRDTLFASGSGLDPHISPEAAKDQVERIAKTRNAPAAEVTAVLNEHIESRQFGFLGQKRVNVLKLNLALDERFK